MLKIDYRATGEAAQQTKTANDYILIQGNITIPNVPAPRSRLTNKQVEVQRLHVAGKSPKEIARILGTSLPNIYKHLRRYKRNCICATMTQEQAWQVGI